MEKITSTLNSLISTASKPLKRAFRDLLNAYRKHFCGSKARPLEDGEYHVLCANFEGPGTNIKKYKNVEPFNDVDRCARQHDIDYSQGKIKEGDRRFLKCIEKYPYEEPYYSLAKYGIETKNAIAAIPLLSSLVPSGYR